MRVGLECRLTVSGAALSSVSYSSEAQGAWRCKGSNKGPAGLYILVTYYHHHTNLDFINAPVTFLLAKLGCTRLQSGKAPPSHWLSKANGINNLSACWANITYQRVHTM